MYTIFIKAHFTRTNIIKLGFARTPSMIERATDLLNRETRNKINKIKRSNQHLVWYGGVKSVCLLLLNLTVN